MPVFPINAGLADADTRQLLDLLRVLAEEVLGREIEADERVEDVAREIREKRQASS